MNQEKIVHEHLNNENKGSKSNVLFNTLFLIFSFAVITVASGNFKLTDSAFTQSPDENIKTEVVIEQEYAVNSNVSKAIYQHKM